MDITPAAPAAPATTEPAAQPAQSWFATAPQEVQDWMITKGVQGDLTPDVALNAFNGWRSAEKLIGVPADRVVKLPADDNVEAWGEVFNKLGRPTDKTKYEIELGDAPDNAFVDWAKDTFHELGLTNKQAKALSQKWNEYAGSAVNGQNQAMETKFNDEIASLKKEWGAAYDARANVVDRVAMQLNVQPEALDALKKAMGPQGAMNFLYNIGAKTGEAEFVAGNSNGGFNGVMTPADAKSRIRSLQADKDFVAKYTSGSAAAKEEMKRLHMLAYPEA